MTAPQEPGSNPRRAFIAAAGAGVAGLGFTAIAPGLHLMAVGQADAAEVRKAGSAACHTAARVPFSDQRAPRPAPCKFTNSRSSNSRRARVRVMAL